MLISRDERNRTVLQQAVETYRVQIGILTQYFGFFVVGDLAVLAAAANEKDALLASVGMLLTITMILARYQILKATMPVAYVAIRAELELFGSEGGLISHYIAMELPHAQSVFAKAVTLKPIAAQAYLAHQKYARDLLLSRVPLALAAWAFIQAVVTIALCL